MMNKKIKHILAFIAVVFLVFILISLFLISNRVCTLQMRQSAFQEWIIEYVEKYKTVKGFYPNDLNDLLEIDPQIQVKRLVTDSWGGKIFYQSPGEHNKNSYDLWSFGADGKLGGEADDADIQNWK